MLVQTWCRRAQVRQVSAGILGFWISWLQGMFMRPLRSGEFLKLSNIDNL